jgi:probable addiction module antidote protein
MPKRSSSYKENLLGRLADPMEAAGYLNAALEDPDERVFLLALRDVAESKSISKVAKGAALNREGIYRMLSKSGNPRFTSLVSVLRVLGLGLGIQPVEPLTEVHEANVMVGVFKPDVQARYFVDRNGSRSYYQFSAVMKSQLAHNEFDTTAIVVGPEQYATTKGYSADLSAYTTCALSGMVAANIVNLYRPAPTNEEDLSACGQQI